MTTNTDGTVDITNLVESLKSTWIAFTTKAVMTGLVAIPYVGWFFAWPGVNQITEFFVDKGVTFAGNTMEMGGFFLNTAIRKAGQATDFLSAVAAKESLPPTVSDEDYLRAEQAQMAAFSNFVRVTN